jgi:YD repeat-containing protein
MNKASLRCLLALLKLLTAIAAGALISALSHAQAQGQVPVAYYYDQLGRLIGITDASGTSATYAYDPVGNILSVSRTSANQLAIVGFTPNGGSAGATVTISGSGFSATATQNDVKFNQTPATVISATPTQIVTSVPAGASTGPITVATPTGTASSSTAFIVEAAKVPTITGFTPGIGSAGTAINIAGTNFEPSKSDNKVSLNGRAATTSSATTTGITASVPPSASSGKITVATAYGTAVSSADFFVPPPPYTSTDIEVTDRISIGQSKTVVIAAAGKKGLILFDGSAGQRVSLSLSAVTVAGGAVSIIAANGAVLGSTSISTSGGFIDALVLPSTGTYTILINPSATSKGSITLTLTAVQNATASITIGGPAVTMTTTVPGQNAQLTFSGTAGQRISLNVTAISSTLNCPSFSIVKPDGSDLIAPNYNCASSYFIDVTVLPATGSYTVVMDPRAANVGSATFALSDVPQDATAAITPGGPAVTMTTTVPGQNAGLTFSGTAGQRISLNVTAISSTLSCPSFSIVKPDGTNLVAPNYNCASSYFIDVTVLPVTGSYTVVMNPKTANIGSATFALFEVPSDATGNIGIGGAAVAVTTTVPGQNANITFSGIAGQQVTARLTSSTLGCQTTSLRKPDGSVLVSSFSCSASLNLAPQVLPLTGTYVIRTDPSGPNIGNASVGATSP